jgi:hypothetical protein
MIPSLRDRPDMTKLTSNDAVDIILRALRGEPCRTIAEKYGIDRHTVRMMSQGRTCWQKEHALAIQRFREEGGVRTPPWKKLTFENAVEIARRRLNGEKCDTIAEDFGVTVAYPAQISRGRVWKGAVDRARELVEGKL